MRRLDAKLVFFNLLLLLLGMLPLVFLLIWIGNLMLGRYEDVNVVNAIASGFTYAVVYFLPVLVGGLAHQVLLAALPRSWSLRARRGAAVVLTIVVPVVLLLFGQPVDVLGWFAVPVGVALLAYGLLMRLPRTPASHPRAVGEKTVG
jgi:hypothetical protein